YLSKNFQHNETKKDRILKMLLDNKIKHSAKEIARTVGTTEGNVFKEKSRLKAQGVLTDQSFSVFSHSVGDETLTLARAEARTLTRPDLGTLTNIPPLGQEDLKKMYVEFQKGKTPVEVIAAYGFNPLLVEYEYNRFCRMNGLNLRSLAHELDDVLKTTNNSLPTPLLQRLVQDGITCNDDIRELVEFASISSYSGGELSVIEHMRKGDSISEFEPFVCSICRKPMRGAVIEPESEIGRKLLQSIGSGVVHDKCNFEFTSRVVG
ncbi:MAG TPA: hypothetical protein VFG77_06925, partial [Nitrososphaeraceae archaeon]|nr:hypothetical protein [Nitrososphaeraceae archaeon]